MKKKPKKPKIVKDQRLLIGQRQHGNSVDIFLKKEVKYFCIFQGDRITNYEIIEGR